MNPDEEPCLMNPDGEPCSPILCFPAVPAAGMAQGFPSHLTLGLNMPRRHHQKSVKAGQECSTGFRFHTDLSFLALVQLWIAKPVKGRFAMSVSF